MRAKVTLVGLPVLLLTVMVVVPFTEATSPDWGSVTATTCVDAVIVNLTQPECAAWVCVAPIVAGSPGNYCENLRIHNRLVRVIFELVAAPTMQGPNDQWTVITTLTISGGTPEPCGEKTFTPTNPPTLPHRFCFRDVEPTKTLVEGNRLFADNTTHLAPSQATTGVSGLMKLYIGCEYDSVACRLDLPA